MSDKNLPILLKLLEKYRLTRKELVLNSGYSYQSVSAWLMKNRTSKRARAIPDRAITTLTEKIRSNSLIRVPMHNGDHSA